MATTNPASRRLPHRSMTWPPIANISESPIDDAGTKSAARASDAVLPNDFFEDSLDSHPEDYFLSPMQPYEYEDWTSDSDFDSDESETEWDAGITDFALFDDERQEAKDCDLPLPSKWNHMLAQQASALKRADQRSRVSSEPASSKSLLPSEDVPGLTPDASPNLRDDLEVDADNEETTEPKSSTVVVTPPERPRGRSLFEDEDADLPLFLKASQKQAKAPVSRKLERPGLKHSRTMSGRRHSWRQPSPWLYTVGEEVENERAAG